jgi:hypothetical protein
LFRQNKRFSRNLLRSWHLVACTNTIRFFAGVETSLRAIRNASVEIPSISGRQKLISDVRPQITILQRVWKGSKNWRVAARGVEFSGASPTNKHKLRRGAFTGRHSEIKIKGRNSRLQVLEDSVDGSPVDEQVAVHPAVHGCCCASASGERRAFARCKGRWPTALPDAVPRQGRGRSQTARIALSHSAGRTPAPNPRPPLSAQTTPSAFGHKWFQNIRRKGARCFGAMWRYFRISANALGTEFAKNHQFTGFASTGILRVWQRIPKHTTAPTKLNLQIFNLSNPFNSNAFIFYFQYIARLIINKKSIFGRSLFLGEKRCHWLVKITKQFGLFQIFGFMKLNN